MLIYFYFLSTLFASSRMLRYVGSSISLASGIDTHVGWTLIILLTTFFSILPLKKKENEETLKDGGTTNILSFTRTKSLNNPDLLPPKLLLFNSNTIFLPLYVD